MAHTNRGIHLYTEDAIQLNCRKRSERFAFVNLFGIPYSLSLCLCLSRSHFPI